MSSTSISIFDFQFSIFSIFNFQFSIFSIFSIFYISIFLFLNINYNSIHVSTLVRAELHVDDLDLLGRVVGVLVRRPRGTGRREQAQERLAGVFALAGGVAVDGAAAGVAVGGEHVLLADLPKGGAPLCGADG